MTVMVDGEDFAEIQREFNSKRKASLFAEGAYWCGYSDSNTTFRLTDLAQDGNFYWYESKLVDGVWGENYREIRWVEKDKFGVV